MAANSGINLLELLPPGHIDDIVLSQGEGSYAMMYQLTTITRETVLDNIKLNKISVWNIQSISPFGEEAIGEYEKNRDMLYNYYSFIAQIKHRILYDDDTLIMLSSMIKHEFSRYRKTIAENGKHDLLALIMYLFWQNIVRSPQVNIPNVITMTKTAVLRKGNGRWNVDNEVVDSIKQELAVAMAECLDFPLVEIPNEYGESVLATDLQKDISERESFIANYTPLDAATAANPNKNSRNPAERVTWLINLNRRILSAILNDTASELNSNDYMYYESISRKPIGIIKTLIYGYLCLRTLIDSGILDSLVYNNAEISTNKRMQDENRFADNRLNRFHNRRELLNIIRETVAYTIRTNADVS